MKQFPECRPNLWDGLVVLVVLALALGSGWRIWGGQEESGALTAVVSVNGVEDRRVELSDLQEADQTVLAANGYELQLLLTQDGAEIVASDCPTQDCVHTGKITRAGQSIVCLPARVSVQLVGGETADGLDAVIG